MDIAETIQILGNRMKMHRNDGWKFSIREDNTVEIEIIDIHGEWRTFEEFESIYDFNHWLFTAPQGYK